MGLWALLLCHNSLSVPGCACVQRAAHTSGLQRPQLHCYWKKSNTPDGALWRYCGKTGAARGR